MHRRSLRSTVAVAAIAALSLTAAAGTAVAAKPAKPSKPRTTAHARSLQSKPPALRRALRLAATDITRVKPIATRVKPGRFHDTPLGEIGGAVVYLKGTSTGKGPATNDDCQKIADAAETVDKAGDLAFYEIELELANALWSLSDSIVAAGQAVGCEFI